MNGEERWIQSEEGVKSGAWNLFNLNLTADGRAPFLTSQNTIIALEPLDGALGFLLATEIQNMGFHASSAYSSRFQRVTLSIESRHVDKDGVQISPTKILLRAIANLQRTRSELSESLETAPKWSDHCKQKFC